MRVRFGGTWIADSEHVLLLFEPGRYPVAYFPETDVSPHTLEHTDHTTQHPDLGLTSWYRVRAGEHVAPRGAWQHTGLPAHASELQARVAFAWRAMDAFYEEDERIVGHAADSYHRIDAAFIAANTRLCDTAQAHGAEALSRCRLWRRPHMPSPAHSGKLIASTARAGSRRQAPPQRRHPAAQISDVNRRGR
jgi:uncharacterized protein (DUF427 family)